jgi:hypothetical protein
VAALCAALAFMPFSLSQAQNAHDGTAGPVKPVLVRPSNENAFFAYPGSELWNPAKWENGRAKAAPILTWITTHQRDARAEYQINKKYQGIKDFTGHPDYTWKTENITDPDVVGPLKRMGLNVDAQEQGGNLVLFVTPAQVLADKAHRVPVLIVPYVVARMDPFWAMNTLVHFRKYNELLAKSGDFSIIYVVMDKASAARPLALGSTFDKSYDIYRGDGARIYFDVSVFKENKAKIADVPGLDWSDQDGRKRDPDAEVASLGFIPVLNVAGQWIAKPSPGVGLANPRPELVYDPQRVVHGILGQRIMEGTAFVYNHGKSSDPAIKAHFEQMGLVGGERDYQGERYFLFSPRQAVEQGKKLPLVLVIAEVYRYQDYAASDIYAEFLDYFRLAAQGDLNVLFFAGETPETVEAAYDIIKQAEQTSPIDPSRIYVTGHSHNGHLAREFAYRHPDMVAAVAQLGNSPGLAPAAYSHEAVVADDEHIQAWSKIDMPIVVIGAASEVTSPHTMRSTWFNDYDRFLEAWQRRLTASRSPMKTPKEIMATEHDANYVTRLFGLPNDGSSVQVIDGVEHYIIDIKNIDGNKHLRIVGIDNMVHSTEPTMPTVAWTFMNRFARDPKTKAIIELY